MERKPEEEESGRQSEAWRARVAADLAAHAAEQRRLWGGIDEMTLARYAAGASPDEERQRVEQAMRDHPALRQSMEIDRELSAQEQGSAPADDAGQKRRGEKPWADRTDPPESELGKPR